MTVDQIETLTLEKDVEVQEQGRQVNPWPTMMLRVLFFLRKPLPGQFGTRTRKCDFFSHSWTASNESNKRKTLLSETSVHNFLFVMTRLDSYFSQRWNTHLSPNHAWGPSVFISTDFTVHTLLSYCLTRGHDCGNEWTFIKVLGTQLGRYTLRRYGKMKWCKVMVTYSICERDPCISN